MGRFRRNKEINSLPVVKDEHGKIMPKDISPMPGEILLHNEWFTDSLLEAYNPEDDIITMIDACREGKDLEEDNSTYIVRQGTTGLVPTSKDISIKQFDIHQLAKETLNKQERRIFELIFIDNVSYRKAEEILGIDHCKIFNDYKKILKKLGNKLIRKNK